MVVFIEPADWECAAVCEMVGVLEPCLLKNTETDYELYTTEITWWKDFSGFLTITFFKPFFRLIMQLCTFAKKIIKPTKKLPLTRTAGACFEQAGKVFVRLGVAGVVWLPVDPMGQTGMGHSSSRQLTGGQKGLEWQMATGCRLASLSPARRRSPRHRRSLEARVQNGAGGEADRNSD